MYRALADAIRDAEARDVTLSHVALEVEAKDQGRTVESIRDALRRALVVMREAVDRGMIGDLKSSSGLVGGGRRQAAHRPRWAAGQYPVS